MDQAVDSEIKVKINTSHYYMASSASGQDEPNRALWLATRADKMDIDFFLKILPLNESVMSEM